jgi:hypothetical protein
MKLTPDYKLFMPMPNLSDDEIIRRAKALLQELIN